MMTHWDQLVAQKLRAVGLSQDQIGYVLGLLAEHRMQADQEGYKRGFEQGFIQRHPSGCRCPICSELGV